jgi:Uncharacterized conserved protein
MLNFQPIKIEDKDLIQPYFDESTFRNCDFSFSNIFGWSHFYDTTFAIEDNCLYFRFIASNESHSGYLFPLGGDTKKMIERIMQDAEERGDIFHIYSVTLEMYRLIEEAYPDLFEHHIHRDSFDYIYNSKDLITLVGKSFQPKRNHINKFKKTYNWEYLPITRDIIPDCMKLYKRWCKENGGCQTEKSLIEEGIATEKVFENFDKLGLKGGALRIDGEILAYSYGQPLTKDTFGVHAEKSLYEINGGFAMMNQQFAEHNCADYLYINREEDLGYESLRKAKLSYQPAILLEKGTVKKKLFG